MDTSNIPILKIDMGNGVFVEAVLLKDIDKLFQERLNEIKLSENKTFSEFKQSKSYIG